MFFTYFVFLIYITLIFIIRLEYDYLKSNYILHFFHAAKQIVISHLFIHLFVYFAQTNKVYEVQ